MVIDEDVENIGQEIKNSKSWFFTIVMYRKIFIKKKQIKEIWRWIQKMGKILLVVTKMNHLKKMVLFKLYEKIFEIKDD